MVIPTHLTYDAFQAMVKRTVGAGYRSVSALVWPPRSPVTGGPVSAPGLIEPDIWKTLTFCRPPLCAGCGFGFDLDPGPGQFCAACRACRPVVDHMRSALVYNDTSRKMIMALKYGGRRDALGVMASWMDAASRNDGLDRCDALVPVPLHYRRFVRRGFNQSVWLAAALARRTGVALWRRALVRTRSTSSQRGKSVLARRRNVQRAFRVAQPERVCGRHLVLIDDVVTTGATLNECAAALKSCGAVRVDALTVARVDGSGFQDVGHRAQSL